MARRLRSTQWRNHSAQNLAWIRIAKDVLFAPNSINSDRVLPLAPDPQLYAGSLLRRESRDSDSARTGAPQLGRNLAFSSMENSLARCGVRVMCRNELASRRYVVIRILY